MTDKELREAAGLSQTEVAKLVGTTRKTIYTWEKENNYKEELRTILKGKINSNEHIKEMEHLHAMTEEQLDNISKELLRLYSEASND